MKRHARAIFRVTVDAVRTLERCAGCPGLEHHISRLSSNGPVVRVQKSRDEAIESSSGARIDRPMPAFDGFDV
jgi:hypothetical protein